jgi:nitroreductase
VKTNAVIEAMETCRAMRELKPDPVPDELVETALHAATRASNPNNSQLWSFVVVRDPAQRAHIAKAFEPHLERVKAIPAGDDKLLERRLASARNLVGGLASVPVIIFVCARNEYPPEGPLESMMYSAAFAASQNLIVAARSLGLGATFTTLNLRAEPELRTILEIPDDVTMVTTIPLGWPARPFGPVRRKPLAEVVHHDRWRTQP